MSIGKKGKIRLSLTLIWMRIQLKYHNLNVISLNISKKKKHALQRLLPINISNERVNFFMPEEFGWLFELQTPSTACRSTLFPIIEIPLSIESHFFQQEF